MNVPLPSLREVWIGSAPRLPAILGLPVEPRGVVIFAHGSGSGRLSPRNNYVAERLRECGFATVLLDLLTGEEEQDRRNVFDIGLLASRLAAAAHWAEAQDELAYLPIGFFGASTGAGAALQAAARHDIRISAVVSRGGRPDLAGEDALRKVRAPTLLIVGGEDAPVIDLNAFALDLLSCPARLEIVLGAGHLFEEPGTLAEVVRLARSWFLEFLAGEV